MRHLMVYVGNFKQIIMVLVNALWKHLNAMTLTM
nr:MAG TPA: hypothetical protein [Caudoviricetes sp.]